MVVELSMVCAEPPREGFTTRIFPVLLARNESLEPSETDVGKVMVISVAPLY